MLNNIAFLKTRRVIVALGLAVLAFPGLLTGCGTNTGQHIPNHSFSGKLTLVQLPAPYSIPGKMLAAPDGKTWFPAVAFPNFGTHNPSGGIGYVTPNGTFRIFPLPSPNSYPLQLTFGPGGNLWFTLFQGNGKLTPIGDTAPSFTGGYGEIGSMTPDGTFAFFPLPSRNASLSGIAAGPDGNLWFAETLDQGSGFVQKIGSLTPTGTFHEFASLPLPARDILGPIIATPDGNLWFAIDSYDPSNYDTIGQMGRITPQGVVKIFQLGTFNEPSDLTIGPDHNLWFSTNMLIGRLTLDGQLRMFNPDPHAKPEKRIEIGGLTAGSDGALWFATRNVEVGRLTTGGTFAFYPFPENTFFDNGGSSLTLGQLKGIVTAADGTLWLNDANQLGHFV